MEKELFDGQNVGATPSYKEQAYRLIKDAILFNRFRVGAIYSQENICKELGISRTPVREALLELQKDGYVSFARGKGVQVIRFPTVTRMISWSCACIQNSSVPNWPAAGRAMQI